LRSREASDEREMTHESRISRLLSPQLSEGRHVSTGNRRKRSSHSRHFMRNYSQYDSLPVDDTIQSPLYVDTDTEQHSLQQLPNGRVFVPRRQPSRNRGAREKYYSAGVTQKAKGHIKKLQKRQQSGLKMIYQSSQRKQHSRSVSRKKQRQ